MNPLFQNAKTVWLVKPAVFHHNEETQESNSFQKGVRMDNQLLFKEVQIEFDALCESLEGVGIRFVASESKNINTPDAIFPNNWVSFHHDGTAIIYPMLAPNRRMEKDQQILEKIKQDFQLNTVIDLSYFENENKFLEGTGSIVFDHINKVSYASKSPRTDEAVLKFLMDKMGYESFIFASVDKNELPIYHTNVMLNIGETYAVVCSESIKVQKLREELLNKLIKSGREIIEINYDQLYSFAGNMLQVLNKDNEAITILSTTAFDSLSDKQISTLLDHTKLLRVDIPQIERVGGGSVRCMLAEIFLPEKIN